MARATDYERVAATFDRRYERTGYDRVTAYLLDWAEPRKGLKVLEVGCGTGHWLEVLETAGCQCAGLDPSPGMLAKARARDAVTRLSRGRGEKLPFGDELFDRVFFLNALHHVPDPRAAIEEARRVLAPRGRFLTMGLDPHEGRDRWFIYDYFENTLAIDKERYPSTERIREDMRRGGFTEAETQVAEGLPLNESARTALDRGRVDKSTTSQLSVLTDEEYERGIRAIEAEIQTAQDRGEDFRLTADLRLWATTGIAR